MIEFKRECQYCEYYDLPVISCTHNPCEDCFSYLGFPHFELKEEIKMSIESEKNCDTCKFGDLPKCEHPCCDCYEDNNYKYFKEQDEEPKGTVNQMFEVIDILNEFGKDYSGESAFDFGNKEEIKVAIESEKNCETCGLKDLDNNMYPCCDCNEYNGYGCWEPKNEEPKEIVNHPNHYQSSRFEVIDIIDEFGKDYSGESAFDFGNVVKYILRAKKKNGLEDLRKARWYLDRLIDKWED